MQLFNYYQYTFSYDFQQANDEVFCAFTVPYSYSNLQTHLKQLKLLSVFDPKETLKIESLGRSLGGLDIPLLKISNWGVQPETPKPVILIVGRQHSGETHSSFAIHSLTNLLLTNDPLSHAFRQEYECWIVPMINPDGVVCGNYRCTLQGRDMNRLFLSDEDTGSRVYEVELLRTLQKSVADRCKLFLDVHADGSRLNAYTLAPEFDDAI